MYYNPFIDNDIPLTLHFLSLQSRIYHCGQSITACSMRLLFTFSPGHVYGQCAYNLLHTKTILKARCWKPPGHYQCIPEPGRPDCVISIEIGVNGEAYPVAISPKVTKNIPVSFYSPTSGFKFV